MSAQKSETTTPATAKKSRKSKRKAKSPLLADSGQTGSGTGGVSDSCIVNKRLNMNDRSFTDSPVNTMNNMNNMGINQNATPPGTQFHSYAYGMQMPQGPPLYQHAPPVPVAQSASATTPPWAVQMIEDMKLLKESIPKINNIEKTVGNISVKMHEIETRMKQMEMRVAETEKSCEFMNATTEHHKKDLAEAASEIDRLKKKCDLLDKDVSILQTEKQTLSSKITDIETRSMRDNLIFYGIAEQTGENCEEKVKAFIRDNLGIDDNFSFDRVHRLGSIGRDGVKRPIVAKFHHYKEREKVREKAYTERNELKTLGYGVGVQFPKEVREARKLLYPIMKREESKGKNVRLVYDKLYINKVLYNPENEQQSMD